LEAELDRHDTHALAAGGALASLVGHRRNAAWTVAGIERRPPVLRQATIAEQEAVLGTPSEANELIADYATLGLTLGRHPLALLRSRFQRLRMIPAVQLRELPHGRATRTIGLVIGRQRPDTASGVIFVTLEDETGITNIVLWARMLEQFRREVMSARLMQVEGVVEKSTEGVVHVVARRVIDRTAELARLSEDHDTDIQLARADIVAHPQLPRHPPHRHPRDVRILPGSRDFH
jgi:error-prone DNA polymerase